MSDYDYDENDMENQFDGELDIYGNDFSSTDELDAIVSFDPDGIDEDRDALGGVVDNDLTASWLEQAENKIASDMLEDHARDTDRDSRDLAMGGITSQANALVRIGGMSDQVRLGIKNIASGKRSLFGDFEYAEAKAAQEALGVLIQGDPKEFAKLINVDASVTMPRSSKDMRMVLSAMKTGEKYEELGPGLKVAGNELDMDKVYIREQEVAQAYEDLASLGEAYLDPRTIGTSVEAGRRKSIETALYKRIVEGVFYEGSTVTAPMPNELYLGKDGDETRRVTGTVRTQGIYSSKQGTALNRLDAQEKFGDHYQQLDPTAKGYKGEKIHFEGKYYDAYPDLGDSSNIQKTRYARNEEGHRLFNEDVSEEEQARVLKNTPSLANSLHPKPQQVKGELPFTQEERDHHTRTQKWQMAQTQRKVDNIRRVLRRETPTLRDESNGNIEGNTAGFDLPQDEQADRASLINELTIQGLERDPYSGGTEREEEKAKPLELGSSARGGEGHGTPTGGMYGTKALSEIDIAMEEDLDPEESMPHGDYEGVEDDIAEWRKAHPLPETRHKQGSPEWLAEREGLITASAIAGITGKKGVEKAALNLIYGDDFEGNSDTAEGNAGEATAQRAFMSDYGKDLAFEEAFFTKNDDYVGFGVSPDGLLKNKDGTSAGLLELKYLSPDSMEGAASKYYDQMQLQMAIAEEDQVHFYALDKISGTEVYEVIKADTVRQGQLIEAGREALKLAEELNYTEANDMRERHVSKFTKAQTKGQEEAKEEVFGAAEAEGEIPVFEGAKDIVVDIGPLGDKKEPTESSYMKERGKSVADMEVMKGQQLGPATEVASKKNARKLASEKAAAAKAARTAAIENSIASEAAADANAKLAKESAEAAKSVGKFGKAAIAAVGKLAGMLTKGNNSAMDTIRFAAGAGMTTESARGMEFALQSGKGGMTLEGARANMQTLGELQTTLNDPTQVEAKMTDIATKWAGYKIEGDAPTYEELEGMNPKQLAAFIADLQKGQTSEMRKNIDATFGTSMSVSKLSGDEIRAAEIQVDEEGNRSYYDGQKTIELGIQKITEEVAATGGETLGKTDAVIDATADVVAATPAALVQSAVTVGTAVGTSVLANKLMGGGKSPSVVSSLAKNVSGKAPAISKLAKGAKGGAAGMLVAGASYAARSLLDIEDDGGVADSFMDVAEFTAGGAAAGFSVAGPIGAAVGGVAGFVGGMANEAYEQVFDEPLIPALDSSFGGSTAAAPVNVSNNIDVNFSVDKDTATTSVDVDGVNQREEVESLV